MKSIVVLFSVGLIVVAGFFGQDDKQAVSNSRDRASVQQATKIETPATKNPDASESDKAEAKTSAVHATDVTDSRPVNAQQSADDAAIRLTTDSFAKAYAEGDAKAAAAHFTSDAEYVNESGTVVEGRAAIEQSFTELFAANPNCRLVMNVDSIRFTSKGRTPYFKCARSDSTSYADGA